MHITLYRKYRPGNFDEVAGEEDIIRTIKNSLRENKLSHAYLFTGPRGVGKTTTARLISKGLNCLENGITDTPCGKCSNCLDIAKNNFIDLIEIDAASNRGIDEIRALKDKINYQPSRGRKKVYIIDEVHMLTKEAFNALLKTLEEPPAHVMFILATTEPDKILDTIISRCQRYDFKPVSSKSLVEYLEMICEKEGVKATREALLTVYEKSEGSMRDAISILEKLITSNLGEEITLENTEKILGVIPKKKIKEFLEIISKKERERGIKFLDSLWDDSINVEDFLKDFSYYLKDEMVKGTLEIGLNTGIKIIEDIYEVIGKFKHEEDKRLIGYIILYKTTEVEVKKEESKPQVVEKIVYRDRVVEKTNNSSISQEKEEVGRAKGISLDIDEVKNNWREIVQESKKRKMPLISFLTDAKPVKFEDGKLYIGFYKENKFHKVSMEKPDYNKVFLDVLREKFGGLVLVEYFLLNGKDKPLEEPSDFVEKVADYFNGDII